MTRHSVIYCFTNKKPIQLKHDKNNQHDKHDKDKINQAFNLFNS